ncbi:c-type cytochrome biogenesis protein CcmI [Azospirillum halopraeferens]|uniref:c-type cytochrome biogenesis protein CcmI n=1 Tax=Azospirillum halopraeferens TaxID=34010 RepID=UPI00041E467B|nr:c-type cytochrome biogenesis protein CcmI [Azospirillum halopraeferens]
MLFWIVAAAMTAGVVLLIVPPLLKTRGAAGSRAAYDLEVYRDQLTELERERARGVITDTQAAAARAEIGRRMLAVAAEAERTAAAATAAEGTVAPWRSRAVAAVIALALPLGALAVYLPLGHPDQPAVPLASRDLQQERGGPPPQVMAAMDQLRAHLAANPDDRQGWDLLGRTYARMGDYPRAADALGRVVALAPDDMEALAAWAEMLTNANSGIVPEQAQTAFAAVLEKDPQEPRSRFYLALSRFQAGDIPGALERWRTLAAETPADAPWLPAVQDRIRDAAGRMGIDAASVMPQPAPPRAAASAPADDPAIRAMVDSLANRLRDDPSDAEGWQRLARSYSVLGEHDKAVEAGRQAVERAPGNVGALLAYADALLGRAPHGAAGAGGMPADATEVLHRVLALEPGNPDALWLLGLDAALDGRTGEASELWNRLLAGMAPNDPNRSALLDRIERLKTGG